MNQSILPKNESEDSDKISEIIILAGGPGTRLRGVISDKPKILAPIANRPFLEIILDKIFPYQPQRIILAVGHLKDQVRKYINSRAKEDNRFASIALSEEESPLGTGGALKLATQLTKGKDFIAMNGDTIFEVDLLDFFKFHKEKANHFSVAAVNHDGGMNHGTISTDASGQIKKFDEKKGLGQYASAGVYVMNRELLKEMPEGPFSLEYDFFPVVSAKFHCGVYPVSNYFLDIGTPEKYEIAQKLLDN